MSMTIEEAKKMVGTEFIYKFLIHKVLSYVKWIDPSTGQMTCHTLEVKTNKGHSPNPLLHDVNDDGTWCILITKNFRETREVLEVIRDTGECNLSALGCISGGQGFKCNML